MKKLKIADSLFLAESEGKGLGVFTKKSIPAKKIVERSIVLAFDPKQRKLLEQTDLHNYIFEWEEDNKSCCLALGYISMYNHSYDANCEYIMDFEAKTVVIKTVKDLKAGQELTINYNGEPKNDTPVWFDAL